MLLLSDDDLAVFIQVDGQFGAGSYVGGDHPASDEGLHMALQVTLQRPGAEDGVEAPVDHGVHGSVGQGDFQLLVLEAFVQTGDHQADDRADLVPGQGLVIHDLIDPVQELGPEVRPEHPVDLRAGFGRDLAVGDAVEDELAAQVTGHDQDGVLEVYGAALAVGDPAVVKHLQEDVEDIRMGFFHFIKQHDAVGVAADRFGQLAALVVSHISGRRPDEPGDAELLHVFGHIDPDHVLLVVEQCLRQRLGQLGFADAGRTEEQEGTEGSVRILDARTGAQDGLGDLFHGLVLADNPLVQDILQVEELLALAFHELGDGDAGPAADNPGDLFFGNLVPQEAVLTLALLGDSLFLLQILLQLRQFAILQFRGAVQIVGALRLLDLGIDTLNLLAEGADLADGFLFRFPAGLHGVELVPLLGKFLLDLVQLRLGKGIFLPPVA